jgi:DNA primase
MANVDFAALKRALTIEQVAAWLQLETTKANDQLRCRCPVNDGGKRALVITPDRGVFFCFAPKCQKGGDLIELVAHCRQLSTRDAALEIQNALLSRAEAPEGLDKIANYLQPEHDAVQTLGITAETAKALGIGYAGVVSRTFRTFEVG